MADSVVTFTFHPSSTRERRDLVLDDINAWEDITRAGLVKPDAKREQARLMAYAYLSDKADVEDVIKRLSEVPQVESESISIAPTRRLV